MKTLIESDLYFTPFIYSASKKKKKKKTTGIKRYVSPQISTIINNNKKMFSYKDQIAVLCARLDSSDGLEVFEVLVTPLLESAGNYYLSCGENCWKASEVKHDSLTEI